MQDRPISWEEHQISAPIIPPQIETLPTHLRHENCGQRSLSLSRFTFGVKVQHSALIMMIVFYESTVLTSGPMIGFLDREKILSEPSVPYVNPSDRS